MKALIKFSVIFFVLFSSCKKDDDFKYMQPRFGGTEIYGTTGQEIKFQEDRIDANRATSNPDSYNRLADEALDSLQSKWIKETPKVIEAVIAAFNAAHREFPNRDDKKLWRRTLRVKMHEDLYRYNPDFGELMLKELMNYTIKVVNGGWEWVPGTRDSLSEVRFVNILDELNPSSKWGLTYGGEFWARFQQFAQDPAKKPDTKRDGLFNTGMWSVTIEVNENYTLKSSDGGIKISIEPISQQEFESGGW